MVVGPFGVGKSSAVDLCQWQLCGSKESSKIDPGKFEGYLIMSYFCFISNERLNAEKEFPHERLFPVWFLSTVVVLFFDNYM